METINQATTTDPAEQAPQAPAKETKWYVLRVVSGKDRLQPMQPDDLGIDWLERDPCTKASARELDLGGPLAAVVLLPEMNFPALRRGGLLRRGKETDREAMALQDMGEPPKLQNLIHILAQRFLGDSLHIEIQILGIADAAKEKAQVAATLEGVKLLVDPPAQLLQKEQMEQFDGLPARRRAHRDYNTHNRH